MTIWLLRVLKEQFILNSKKFQIRRPLYFLRYFYTWKMTFLKTANLLKQKKTEYTVRLCAQMQKWNRVRRKSPLPWFLRSIPKEVLFICFFYPLFVSSKWTFFRGRAWGGKWGIGGYWLRLLIYNALWLQTHRIWNPVICMLAYLRKDSIWFPYNKINAIEWPSGRG